MLNVKSFCAFAKAILFTTNCIDESITEGGHGKVVSCNIHRCLPIHRELTSPMEDTATATCSAIHLEEPHSDLNRLPALTVDGVSMAANNLLDLQVQVPPMPVLPQKDLS